MSGSVNKVILLGNLGQDPKIVTFQDGGKVANLSIATSRRWKDRSSGEKQERTSWHMVVIRAEPLIAVAERLKKGDRVYVEGAQESRQYQKDGVDHWITETVVLPFSGDLQIIPKTKPEGEQSYDR